MVIVNPMASTFITYFHCNISIKITVSDISSYISINDMPATKIYNYKTTNENYCKTGIDIDIKRGYMVI